MNVRQLSQAIRGRSAKERLAHYAPPTADNSCWQWRGSVLNNGYGKLAIAGQQHLAHRLAWREYRGPIPEGLFVCHHCDNRACVNPDHLFLGTADDNMKDMARKGRARYPGAKNPARGERNANSKLNYEKADAIRNDTRSYRLIAADYAVSTHAIFSIKKGRTWSSR